MKIDTYTVNSDYLRSKLIHTFCLQTEASSNGLLLPSLQKTHFLTFAKDEFKLCNELFYLVSDIGNSLLALLIFFNITLPQFFITVGIKLQCKLPILWHFFGISNSVFLLILLLIDLPISLFFLLLAEVISQVPILNTMILADMSFIYSENSWCIKRYRNFFFNLSQVWHTNICRQFDNESACSSDEERTSLNNSFSSANSRIESLFLPSENVERAFYQIRSSALNNDFI